MTPKDALTYNADNVANSDTLRDTTRTSGTMQLLCKWCVLGHYEDIVCSKQKASVNMIDVRHNEVLVITHTQEKKAMYSNPCTQKERLREARVKVENVMDNE